MTRHQSVFNQMLSENKALFDEFSHIHDRYVLSPHLWQEKFNQIGKEVVKIINQYENKLCRKSEKGKYAHFSANLAEKFWQLVRKKFAKIDFVGVKISSAKTNHEASSLSNNFEIKKISF